MSDSENQGSGDLEASKTGLPLNEVEAKPLAEQAATGLESNVAAYLLILQGEVDRLRSESTALKAQLANAKTLIDEITQQHARAASLADSIETNGKTIEERSKHIEASRSHADRVRTEMDNRLTSSAATLNQITGLLKEAEAGVQQVKKTADECRDRSEAEVATTVEGLAKHTANAKQQVSTIAAEVESAKKHGSSIAKHESDSTALMSKIQAKLANAADLEAKNVAALADYETAAIRLKEREAEFVALNLRIEKLLPGATSAGLATEFASRAQTHKPLKNWWQAVFIASIVLILVVAVVEWVIEIRGATPTYEELLRRFIMRLPVVAPLAIAAWYSALRAAQSRQLEEDYAFKAASAASFDGFSKMMANVPATKNGERADTVLAANVLRILAASPQRIYHRDQSSELPTSKIMSDAAGLPSSLKDLASSRAQLRD